ncbi:MAG TPA: lysophospholipid acyltransferase family protein [Thermodesulfobacteriota bacterium]|nr:lysophospholipid acyltransferase family protein [Thermodesulfobacteriota bacterium]
MVWLFKPVKILAFVILVVTFLFISCCVDLVVGNKMAKLRYFSRISSSYLRAALIVLGVKVRLRNVDRLVSGKENHLIISNHLSYLDIFVIFSTVPAVFIANSELEDAFLLGTIIKYSGGVFVERRNRSRLLQDMQHIKDILHMGFNVVLFPEGTTSDGREVKPFKTSFLDAAAGSGVDVLPLCVRYRKIDGEDIDAGKGRLVYFYGDITFYEHFFRLLGLRSISVDLTELEVIPPGNTRKESAGIAFERISAAYREGFGG